MRRLIAVLALLACSLASAGPLRVVSLAPSMTEIMLEVQAGDLLVGVLDGGERPPALRALPSVGRYGQLDMERLLSLRPDLLLLWPGSVPPAQRDQLKRLGIPTFSAEPHSIEQLLARSKKSPNTWAAPTKGAATLMLCEHGCMRCASSTTATGPCRSSTRSGTVPCTPWVVSK
ncbi:periplasmic binding family protein [Pseudomonas putida S610]|nr:periplasmic binding family protein [Pseudomonas putida S610]